MFEFSVLILIPLLSAGVCYYLKNFRLQYSISLFVSAIHLLLSLVIFIGWYKTDLPFFFSTDSLSKLFLLVLSNIYFWVVLVSFSYLKRPVTPNSEEGKKYYFLLLNFYLFANTAAILSNHYGMYWVAAEGTTLSVAPLIYYYRNEEALEAMWKYLFLVSIGIAFAFIGILFLTLSAKGTPLEGQQLFFSEFVKNARTLNPVWLKASFIFIFVGLSTKIGIAPMHSADVDATSNSPSPIAALMSGSLRITALLGVMRIFQIVQPTSTYEFAKTILIIGGLLSLLFAFIFMFKVNNYKRMLAYSSIEHLGIITLGIGIGGLAFVGAMYHIIYNSLNKVVLFFTAGNIHYKYKTREVDGVSSVLNILPWSGWLLLISFLAISAIPPFGIFFSELMIFEGMLFSDKPWILAVTMFLLLFIFINMGKTLFQMLYRKNENENLPVEKERFGIIHFATIVLLILLIAIAVASPNILHENIVNISKDFGIKL
ncbi:MAG: proton-conducting transporter membrane subunit [Ignavibacteria bacterium]|nr:proton-conducting transporter membrane subunit [Ignavibacteria bacterium]